MRLDSNIQWKLSNNTHLNIIELIFKYFEFGTGEVPGSNPGKCKNFSVKINSCPHRRSSMICNVKYVCNDDWNIDHRRWSEKDVSSVKGAKLKKYILNSFNISMKLNEFIIPWFSIDVTTRSQKLHLTF